MNEIEHTTPQSAEAPKPASNAQRTSSERPASEGSARLELPEGALIVLPTRNAVLFPGIVVPLTLGRPQSIAGAQAAAQADKPVGVLLQSDPSIDTPGPEHLHRVGTVAEILRYVTAPDGNHHLVARGARRFRVLEFLPGYPFLVAHVDEVGEAEIYSTEIAARMHQLKERAREAISLLPNVPPEIADAIEQIRVAVGARRFHRQCLRSHAGREAGPARDLRRRRAARQAAALSRPADRGLAAVQADRRADARIARRPPARAHLARAAPPDSEGARRRRGRPGRDRRAARGDRQGRHARGGREAGSEGAEAARAHARGERRARHDPRPISIG